MGRWERTEHTADLSLEAWGETPEDAVQALCEGLLTQVTNPERVRPEKRISLAYEGLDREEALVGFLGEVLYQIFGKGWVFRRIDVEEAGDERIRGIGLGEPFRPERHRIETEVKAATYHSLRFHRDPQTGLWHVRVIFDV